MKWSLKLGRILGINVYIHFTFILLLVFVWLATWASARSAAAGFATVLYLVALFTCVLLHEFGHALAARGYGIPTRDITLLPIGGLARLERMPEKPTQELVVALAGPAVNVVIAFGLFAGLVLSQRWAGTQLFDFQNTSLVGQLLSVNIILVLFNLLPAFPMDGGRVLRALLAMRMSHARATNIAATIGQGMAILFALASWWTTPMLLFIALFVWIGAGQEASATEMKTSITGARVRDAMLTEFRVLSPASTLADAARMLLAGSQQDFPVVQDGQLVGLVTRGALLKGLREVGESAPIVRIMSQNIEVLDPGELLEAALSRVGSEGALAMPVVEHGQLIGLVTAENIGEFFMIRSALGNHSRRNGPPPLPRSARVPPIIVRERV